MNFETEGLEQLKLRLTRLSNVPQIATEELRECAIDIQNLARAMSPLDYGDLIDAIQIRNLGSARNEKGQFYKGGLREFTIFVNNDIAVKHPTEFVTKVGDYAWHVHEYMGWGSNTTDFMPSDKSVLWGMQHGVDSGGKFLERATDQLAPSIHARLARVVAQWSEMP